MPEVSLDIETVPKIESPVDRCVSLTWMVTPKMFINHKTLNKKIFDTASGAEITHKIGM